MGTYTANYNLFLPTVGEQGWGDLVNGNFTTIDTTMKSLSNRIGTLETETDALAADIATLEGVSNGGNIKSASITNSGTITSAGLITGNGGFKGNLTGNVTGSATSATTATTATKLNKTVTVTPTSTVLWFGDVAMLTYCPYVPGVLYTGSFKCRIGNTSSEADLYTLSSSGSWSRTAIKVSTANTDITKSFTSVSCVVIRTPSTSQWSGFYFPTYS